MRNIIRIGAGTDGRNRFVAIALGVALAVGPAVALPAAALAAPATDAAAASTTAGATITLQGADGASLAGHTFNVYQIGTYTGVVLKGNQISSLGIQGTTESNAWADDAITIANGYDKDTSDDITKVGGYDAAGSIAAIDMAKQAKQLSNIQAALNASSRKPATVAGGADLTTQDATLNITVPEEGLYYITDSAGSPIIIGTKSGAGTAMSGAPGRTLGVAVIKSKSVTTDKKVVVDRDGRQVSKQGDAADPVAVTVGDTVTHTIDVTVPNTAVKFKLADAPAGQEYVKGSLKVALSGTATDVTADTVIYDGETQHGAKALPGDATLKKEDRTPADPDITVPAGGLILVNDQSRREDDHAPDERESCGVRLVAVADPFERRLHAGDCRVGEHEAEQEHGDRQWRGHRFLDRHIHQARSQEDERGDGAGHGRRIRAASFPVSDQRVYA